MPLCTVLTQGAHSLHHQSYQARELLTGTVCADGFAVAWYDADVRPEPARYARAQPIWSDPDLASLADLVHSRCMVAAVRNATVAGANHVANCAPFVSGRWSFSLNGYLDGFPQWQDALPAWVTPRRRLLLGGSTDAEWIFHAILSRLDEMDPEPGALASASQGITRDLVEEARRSGRDAYLNIIISDGAQLVATRAGSKPVQNSLYLAVDHPAHPDSAIVASEPFDDEDVWQVVQPDTLLALQGGAPPVRLRI